MFGLYDLSGTSPSGRILAPTAKFYIDAYLRRVPKTKRIGADVSPLFAELHGMPPALFTVGTLDAFFEDNLAMAMRWLAAGNLAELAVYPESPHAFTVFPTAMAHAANRRAARVARRTIVHMNGGAMTQFVYDPTTVEFQENPLPLFKELRDRHPVYHNPDLRFWTLTRFADVWDAVHDHETFASDPGHYPDEPAEPTELMPKAFMDFGIFYMDPPRHNRLRSIMSRAFTVRRVSDLEPSVRRLANELIDGFIDTGHCEFVHDFAAPLSTTVIGELLGVPRDERWQFRLWAEKLEQRDPSITVEVAQKEQQDALAQIFEYLSGLVAARRKAPQGRPDRRDHRRRGRRRASRRTRDLEHVLPDHDRGQRDHSHLDVERCRAPGRAPRSSGRNCWPIRGSLRAQSKRWRVFDSPTVQSPPRVTTRDVTLHGRTIPKGQPVVFVWMAADHDEREFASPERFDIHRRMDRHLGFGHGLHYCMGAPLARLEATSAFEEFHARIPEYHLDGPPVRWASTWLRVIGQVPLGF